MTAVSKKIMGVSSDTPFKIVTGLSRPSAWTTREIRRDQERQARKATKRISVNDRKLRGGF